MQNEINTYKYTSKLSGFHHLSLKDRITKLAKLTQDNLNKTEDLLTKKALSSELSNVFIENSIGSFELPLGIATNFIVNNKQYLIPMAVEESSVIAAASYGAKLASYRGGFIARSSEPILIGQIQLYLNNDQDFEEKFKQKKEFILKEANKKHKSLTARGGGAKDLSYYYLDAIKCLVVNLHVHTCEAMGANIVNTMCEDLSPTLKQLFLKQRPG